MLAVIRAINELPPYIRQLYSIFMISRSLNRCRDDHLCLMDLLQATPLRDRLIALAWEIWASSWLRRIPSDSESNPDYVARLLGYATDSVQWRVRVMTTSQSIHPSHAQGARRRDHSRSVHVAIFFVCNPLAALDP